MTTSKGTIQGDNGIAAVDKEHQIIVEAQAFGAGQEQHTLKPILDGIRKRYRDTGIHKDILESQVIVTADTGFSSEENNDYLRKENINAYIPDNKFRSRDKAFSGQKEKHGKRNQHNAKGQKKIIPASEFQIDAKNKICICPAGKSLWFSGESRTVKGKRTLYFEGNLATAATAT
jgi:hypothetical protein